MKKITVEIDEEWYDYVKRNNWKWREVVGLGIKAKEDNPQLLSRINDLENNMQRAQLRISMLSEENFKYKELLKLKGA